MSSRLTITVWRHIPQGGHPLHLGRILKARGRWNRAGIYGALYTALTREGALAELRKIREQNASGSGTIAFSKRELRSIEVKVQPILDLTDPATIKTLAVDVREFLGDDDGSLEACRKVADFARAQNYRAMIVPSAALEGEKNLVIFPDGPAHELELEVGPDAVIV